MRGNPARHADHQAFHLRAPQLFYGGIRRGVGGVIDHNARVQHVVPPLFQGVQRLIMISCILWLM